MRKPKTYHHTIARMGEYRVCTVSTAGGLILLYAIQKDRTLNIYGRKSWLLIETFSERDEAIATLLAMRIQSN